MKTTLNYYLKLQNKYPDNFQMVKKHEIQVRTQK